MPVKHLANRTTWEIQIPYDAGLRTSPINHWKFSIGNPELSRLSLTLVWILLPITFIF